MDNNLTPHQTGENVTQQASVPQQQYVPSQPPYIPPQQYVPQQQYAPQQSPYIPPQQFVLQQPPYIPPQQPFTPPVQPTFTPQPAAPQGNQPMYQRIDKRVINQCRHKAERHWYVRLFILNILIIVVAIAYFFYSMDENRKYYDNVVDYYTSVIEEAQAEAEEGGTQSSDSESDGEKEDKKTLEEEVGELPENIEYLVMIIFTAIAIPFVVSYAYAQYRSMSVRITEKTYPEIYAIVEEFSQKLGMKRVPKIYMIQGDGVLNAFSSFIPFRQYIEIYADLLEVAYREYHDMDTIRFIIAHEMAHIHYKHATMHYYYGMMFSQLIPIIGPTASRAREYSCDRLAQLLSGSDGVDAMMTLVAGKHLYKQVDKADYVQHALTVKGFFVWCYNLVSSHPVMTKRVIALADPMRGSGKLY